MSTRDELAGVIDHTNLFPGATVEDLERLAREADENGFHAVCVYPTDIPRIADMTGARVCAVVGFPHGKSPTSIKAAEAESVVNAGADEVDMVIDQTALKHTDYDRVVDDIRAVREAVPDATLKVIAENCNLTRWEKMHAYQAAVEGGAEFVKTSTGFGEYGARVDDVKLMAKTLENMERAVGIKVAGGIRTVEDALQLWQASGRDMEPSEFRIGASSSLDILAGV